MKACWFDFFGGAKKQIWGWGVMGLFGGTFLGGEAIYIFRFDCGSSVTSGGPLELNSE